MITIQVSRDLIETMLKTGSVVQQCHVLYGLPDGATFIHAYVSDDGDLVLGFADPSGGPDQALKPIFQTDPMIVPGHC